MKKSRIALLVLLCVLAATIFVSCKTMEVQTGGHTHEFKTYTLKTEPTETATGTATHACECGETEEVSVPVLTDTSVWKAETVDATHTSAGSVTYTSVYGTVKKELPAIAHSFGEWELVTAPTETETGSAKRTCECGETEEVTVSALTDTSVWNAETVPPTHFETGSVTYTSVYGTVKTELPVIAHSFGEWELVTAPTETEIGSAKRTCECGETEAAEVPVLTDTSVWTVETVPPTHFEAGSVTYTSVYGTVTVELAVIPHSFGEWEMTVAPTENDPGKAIRTCECGETEGVDIPVLTDTSVWTVETVPPTHTEIGSATYTSKYGVVTVDIPMIAHTFGDWTMTKEPTETETGSAIHTCVCGAEETTEVPVLTDTSVWTAETVPPTHFETGSATYTSVYGTVTVELPVVPHSFGEWEMTVVPTVNDPGKAIHTCECGESEEADVPVLTDTSVWTAEVLEVHDENSQYVKYTSVYGTVTTEIFLDGHEYGEWEIAVAPTETKTGTAHRVCTDCGHVWEKEIPVLTDTSVWTATVIDATYTEEGSITYSGVYGEVTVVLPKRALPFVDKIYVDFELDESTYFRSGALLTVNSDGIGFSSSYPFRETTEIVLVDPETGKVRVTITYGISNVYDGYVNPETGTIVVLTGVGEAYLWVVQSPDLTQFSVRNSLWENGNRTVSVTVGDKTENIFIKDDVVYFNVTFTNFAGETVPVEECEASETFYVRDASGELIAAYAYDGEHRYELDGLEGAYTSGEDTLILSGHGTLTLNGVAGIYAPLDGADGYAVYTYGENGIVNAYYEVTLADGQFTAVKPMVTLTFDVGDYEAISPMAVNKNVPVALPCVVGETLILRDWLLDGESVGSVYVPTEDVTLTANWKALVLISLAGVTEGDETLLVLAEGDRLADYLYNYDIDPTGHYKFVGWYIDMNGNGEFDEDDELLNDEVELTAEDSGATIIAVWEARKEYVGTYYGVELWSSYGKGSMKYYLIIGEDGSMQSNIQTHNNVKMDGGTVVSYDPTTQMVIWRSASGVQNVFFFDSETGVIAGIYNTYIDSDYIILSSALTAETCDVNGHSAVFANPVVTESGRKGYYAQFVSLNTRAGVINVFLYDNRIYSNVYFTTGDGMALEANDIQNAKTVVVYDAATDEILFTAGTTSDNFNKSSSDTVRELDEYFGVYKNDYAILTLDGIGGFTYGNLTGTYSPTFGMNYNLQAYNATRTAYYRIMADKETGTFTLFRPDVVITYVSEYGKAPSAAVVNMNIPYHLNTALTDATHMFRGWYVRGDASQTLVPVDYVPTKNVTLVAKWDTKYIFTAVLNSESGNTVIEYGEGDLIEIANPRYPDHQFLGWYTTPTFADGTEWTSGSTRIYSDVTVYAKWGPAPAYAHLYLPIEFVGEAENGGVNNGSAQHGYMFTIDPDGTAENYDSFWMFPFSYGITVLDYDEENGTLIFYSYTEDQQTTGGSGDDGDDSGWGDDYDYYSYSVSAATTTTTILRERYMLVRIDVETGVMFMVRSYSDTKEEALAGKMSYDVFLFAPITDGMDSASSVTSAGSYWNSGLTRAMSYTYGGKTYNAFVNNGQVYFNVTFTDMSGNPLTADECATAKTLYVYDADGKLVEAFGYNGTTMVKLDGYQGTYTGEGSILLNGVNTITFGGNTGTYTKAPAGSGYTFDVYMDEGGKTVYYRLIVDKDSMTYTMECPTVHLEFVSEYGTAPAGLDVNLGASFALDMSLFDETHILKGWYVLGDETMTPVDPNYVPTEDVTLVALWKDKVTLTVVLGNGLDTITIDYASGDVTAPVAPTYANGQYFLRWYTQQKVSGFTRKVTYNPTAITADTTIYAEWTKDAPYTVTNDSSYPYLLKTNADGSLYIVSTNKEVSSSSPWLTLKFTRTTTVTVYWTVSSEKGWDKLNIYCNGNSNQHPVTDKSGEDSGSFTMTISAGNEFRVSYTKDSGGDKFDDTVTILIVFN